MVMLWIALAVFWLLGAIGRPKFPVRFGWTDAAVLLLVGLAHRGRALGRRARQLRGRRSTCSGNGSAWGCAFCLARQFIATPREARAMAAVMVALAVAVGRLWSVPVRAYEMPQHAGGVRGRPRPGAARGRPMVPARLARTTTLREPLAEQRADGHLRADQLAGRVSAPWLVMLVGMGGRSGAKPQAAAGHRPSAWLSDRRVLAVDQEPQRIHRCGRGIGAAVAAIPRAAVRIGWKMPAAARVGVAAVHGCRRRGARGPRACSRRASKSFGYRLQYWQSSLQMIADHPLVGCGPGNFQNVYTQYKLPEASEEVADPHNFLLEIWATAGTPAHAGLSGRVGMFCVRPRIRRDGGKADGKEKQKAGSRPSAVNPKSRIGNLKFQIANLKFAIDSPQSLIPQPKSPIPPPTPGAYVLAGGACGFLLSVPVGLVERGAAGRRLP